MKKILWCSNATFTNSPIKSTGSWLQPLAEGVVNDGNFSITNISMGKVSIAQKSLINGITQWTIPNRPKYDYGQTASKKTQEDVLRIIEAEKPDLVHVWGTESCWASIFYLHPMKIKKLLEIQGLLYRYADFYYGGMNFIDLTKCLHLKELIIPSRSLFWKKRIFQKRGNIEKKYISHFEHISYQSEWVRNSLHFLTSSAILHHSKLLLRDEFYNSKCWEYKKVSSNPIVFSTTSAAISYKGYHRLIKTIAIIKRKYPEIQLRIAGNMNVGNKLIDGYSIYLNNLIKEYKLENNITYLGSLNAEQIVNELNNANVCVIPSYVETYCLAFAEALAVGCPTVCAFSGAMPEQANNGIEALFYNPDDVGQCAALIDQLISNKELAINISKSARYRKQNENEKSEVIENQLMIYKSILE